MITDKELENMTRSAEWLRNHEKEKGLDGETVLEVDHNVRRKSYAFSVAVDLLRLIAEFKEHPGYQCAAGWRDKHHESEKRLKELETENGVLKYALRELWEFSGRALEPDYVKRWQEDYLCP
jgi:hypothetical protein